MVEQKKCKSARGRRVPVRQLPPKRAEGAEYDPLRVVYLGDPCDEEAEEKSTIPEVALWRAVICQAIWDFTKKLRNRSDRRREDEVARMYARHWLFGGGKDFAIVCELALLNPEVVAKNLRNYRDMLHMLPPPKRRQRRGRRADDIREALKMLRSSGQPPGNVICFAGVLRPSARLTRQQS